MNKYNCSALGLSFYSARIWSQYIVYSPLTHRQLADQAMFAHTGKCAILRYCQGESASCLRLCLELLGLHDSATEGRRSATATNACIASPWWQHLLQYSLSWL